MGSKPILYGFDLSPPVRAVLLTAKALDLDFEYKQVNTYLGENKTAEYLKKNPQHTVPTLEDEGRCIWDSHAICAYLAEKYGSTDSLYPTELMKRAHVDQRLHFDSGTLFTCLKSVALALRTGQPITDDIMTSVYQAYEFLKLFLANSLYLVGDLVTIADFSCVSTLSSLDIFLPVDGEKFPKIKGWFERLKILPYYEEANGRGIQMAIEMFKDKMAK
uniref:Glutathione S-transferase 1-like n=1 Tax=Megaselia scalaris TaxID=36166 RepID=T1GW10_MEGSC